MMKSILKMILGLLAGALIGLVIAGIGVVCFTDTSFDEFLIKLQSAEFGESMLAAGIGVVAFAISVLILIPLHEAGHLVCGLLSGYRFVSFRVLNFTFVRIDGRLRIKHYDVAGTGGQCLLDPPDLPIEKIPTAWYNFGGVLANIIALLAVAPLLLIKGKPLLTECVVIFLLADLFIILVNGIPMKVAGVGNDAYSMIDLRKSLNAKRGMINALRANARIQQGAVPAELPVEWFETDSEIDYSNALEVSIPLSEASRLVDLHEYKEALRQFEDLYAHKGSMIGLYVKEIECELVFLRLICGDIDGARQLLTPELKKYIGAYRKTMSSKERILCAVALLMGNDRDKAFAIYRDLESRKDGYLLQGEVKSDLAIMRHILGLH